MATTKVNTTTAGTRSTPRREKLPNRVPPKGPPKEEVPPNRAGVSRVTKGRWIDTEAVQRLRKIDMSLSEIADLVGHVRRHAVHKWRTGKGRPSLIQREAIARRLKIPVEDWLEPVERARLTAWIESFEDGRVFIKRGSRLYSTYLRMLGRDRKKTPAADEEPPSVGGVGSDENPKD